MCLESNYLQVMEKKTSLAGGMRAGETLPLSFKAESKEKVPNGYPSR